MALPSQGQRSRLSGLSSSRRPPQLETTFPSARESSARPQRADSCPRPLNPRRNRVPMFGPRLTVGRSLVDLAVGKRCLQCSTPGLVWCESCLAESADPQVRWTPQGTRVFAAAHYEGSVRQAIVAHKEHGHLSLVAPLARLLVSAMGRPDDPLIAPVPSQRTAVRRRGHDHSRRLARAAARICGGTTVSPLRWVRKVDDQSALDVQSRRVNVLQGMAAAPATSGRGIWLVDDIVTTGATVDEAIRALTAAEWTISGVAVVATVERRMALAGSHSLR